jgi:hypothetical protein
MTFLDEVDDDHEVIEAHSALTVITWAGGAIAAGLVIMAIVLLLGPIVGPAVLVALTVAIVRRSAQPEGDT